MLLDAAAVLKRNGVSFELDVLGTDIAADGAVQHRSNALGLSKQVRWHGYVPHEDMRLFFDNADLFVMTSRYEAGPLVVLEAAVAGIPTVGTNVGHLAEWSPTAARAVAIGDAVGLARVIADVLADEAQRLSLAHEAQRRALMEDADETARRFRQLYSELANGPARVAS